MIALIWIAVPLLISTERLAALRAVAHDTDNLARVFEENVVRTVTEIGKMLLFLRHAYEWDHQANGWSDLLSQPFAAHEATLQLSVFNRSGLLIATNRRDRPPQAVNVADRAHFKVHSDAQNDVLFISKPLVDRTSHRWSVQFTRKLVGKDGHFAGVLVASFDPTHLSRFYQSVDLGAGGSVILIGLDGIIRAGGSDELADRGSRLTDPKLLAELRRTRVGRITIAGTDGNPTRIASFRRVRGYPLAVLVAANEIQPDSAWVRNQPLYLASGGALTLLIAFAVALNLRRERRLAETQSQLGDKSRQLQIALENITQGILMIDAVGRIRLINRRCVELLQLPAALTDGNKTYFDLVLHLEANGEFERKIDDQLIEFMRAPSATALASSLEHVRPDGTVLEVRNKKLPGGGFVSTLVDITERRRAEARIAHLARHDPLTGVANRELFRQALDDSTNGLARGQSFGVLLIDLDHFKSINDTYGHLIGDKLLSDVAERLRGVLRPGDEVARLGGDEFAIIAHGISEPSQLAAVAERICLVLRPPFHIDGHAVTIGASVGAAFAPDDGSLARTLLHAADLAMYAAKAAGRDSFKMFSRDMHEGQKARRLLEADLRTALAEQQFELAYQPILALPSRQVTAYEALIRWRHPERGLLPPLDFIGLAEEIGLIVPLGAWVLRTACLDMSRSAGTVRVAVNLSPVQLHDDGLIATVREALDQSGLPADRLDIEITESALLENDEATQQQLQALRTLGVHITMDDFGTGYSSLAYLLSYPIQSLKIDRSFVQELGDKPEATAIVRAITTLAASLGLSTTAEGVETEEQLRVLQELGCTEAQGYLFSRPVPADSIAPSAPGGDLRRRQPEPRWPARLRT